MNISCEIIRDLLPLYQQNKCSSQSTALVEEHIKHCSKCKKELYNIINDETKNLDTTKIYGNQTAKFCGSLLGAGCIGFVLACIVFYILLM